MKKLGILFLVFFYLPILGQINIVTNSGFEQYSSCPTAGAQWNLCTGWNNINMTTGFGFIGTPDYFNTCGTGGTAPPATFSGTCTPQSGNAMMGVVIYNLPYPEYREYLSTQLACSMNPGTTYTLSFWITNGTGIISPWTIKNIGVHFSSTPLTQSGFNTINVVPQCEITTHVATTTWTQYTFTVNPTAVWNYLSFGSFRTDANNNPIQSFPNLGGPASSYASYFVDEIKVFAPNASGNVITSSAANTILCGGNSATLSVTGSGTFTWNTSATGSSIVVTPSVTTTYSVYSGNSSCGTGTSAITVSVSSAELPTVTIQGPLKGICKGTSITLNASGASTYTWSSGQTSSSIVVTPSVSTVYTVSGANVNGCVSQATFSIAVNICQGLKSSELSTKFRAYPNPVLSNLILEFDNQNDVSEIKVQTSTGETLYSFDSNFLQSHITMNQISLELSDLLPGIYLLQLKISESTYFYKLVKE